MSENVASNVPSVLYSNNVFDCSVKKNHYCLCLSAMLSNKIGIASIGGIYKHILRSVLARVCKAATFS